MLVLCYNSYTMQKLEVKKISKKSWFLYGILTFITMIILTFGVLFFPVFFLPETGSAANTRFDHPAYTTIAAVEHDAGVVIEGVVADEGVERNIYPEHPSVSHIVHEVEVTNIHKGEVSEEVITLAYIYGGMEGARYVGSGVPKLGEGDKVVLYAMYDEESDTYHALAGGTAIGVKTGLFDRYVLPYEAARWWPLTVSPRSL